MTTLPAGRERVLLVVQARMGSTRFPAKMTALLGGVSLIDWVLGRVNRAKLVDQVVLATSDQPRDRILGEHAIRHGVAVFYGNENDVLGRFQATVRQYPCQHVVRVCADNPFVSPEEIDRLISEYLLRRPDYAFNHIPSLSNSYPDGLGAEIFSVKLLNEMEAVSSLPRHREHVTLYLWDHSQDYTIMPIPAPQHLCHPHVKLDVDTPHDLDRLNRLSCAHDPACSALEVVKSYLAELE